MPYFIIFMLFISDFNVLQGYGLLSKAIKFVPEIVSLFLFIFVFAHASYTKQVHTNSKYIIIGIILLVHFLLGITINYVNPGAIFTGLRVYLNYVPIFILPMVFDFKEVEILKQLKFILALTLLQAPVAIFQKLLLAPGRLSGDAVRGMMSSSGILSIFLICSMAMLMAFYLKGKINKTLFFTILLVLFAPTTINETKSTLILMPIAFLLPALVQQKSIELKQGGVFGVSMLLGLLLAGFMFVYNQFWGNDSWQITDFFTEGRIADMLYKDQEEGKGYDTGRIDSIMFSISELSEDPVKLVVGLGIGNVAATQTRVLQGDYSLLYEEWGKRNTTITFLMWEVGVIGVIIVIIFLSFILKDAWYMKSDSNLIGILSLAWVAIVVIMFFSMFYKSLIEQSLIGYLFWFFSGYIIAQRSKIEKMQSSNLNC